MISKDFLLKINRILIVGGRSVRSLLNCKMSWLL